MLQKDQHRDRVQTRSLTAGTGHGETVILQKDRHRDRVQTRSLTAGTGHGETVMLQKDQHRDRVQTRSLTAGTGHGETVMLQKDQHTGSGSNSLSNSGYWPRRNSNAAKGPTHRIGFKLAL